jgi:hypothetical protein
MGKPGSFRAASLAIASVLIAPPALAADATRPLASGANLLAACMDTNLTIQMACTAYIAGVIDGLRGEAIAEGRGTGICLPAGMIVRHIQRNIVAQLRTQPSALHHPPGPLVYVAAKRLFPCAVRESVK